MLISTEGAKVTVWTVPQFFLPLAAGWGGGLRRRRSIVPPSVSLEITANLSSLFTFHAALLVFHFFTLFYNGDQMVISKSVTLHGEEVLNNIKALVKAFWGLQEHEKDFKSMTTSKNTQRKSSWSEIISAVSWSAIIYSFKLKALLYISLLG